MVCSGLIFLALLNSISISDRAPHPVYYLIRLGHVCVDLGRCLAQGGRKGRRTRKDRRPKADMYIYIYIILIDYLMQKTLSWGVNHRAMTKHPLRGGLCRHMGGTA